VCVRGFLRLTACGCADDHNDHNVSCADKTLSRAARRNWRGVRRVPRREPEDHGSEAEAS
jgi:hypothetical protein